MMDIKDFVSETLKQVIAGVKDAQEFAMDNGAMVEPERAATSQKMGEPTQYVGKGSIKEVAFDIAVTAQESTGQEGKAGLRIPYLDFGGGLSAEQANATVSRVRFAVDVRLPCQKYE
jgi:hypothetical protein